MTVKKRSLREFGDITVDALAERYDPMINDHLQAGFAAASNAMLPLDTWTAPEVVRQLSADSARPSHQSYTYAGHQGALAIDAVMQTSVYLADLLSELPRT